MFFATPLAIQQNHEPEPMNRYIIEHLVISPSKQREQPGALLEVLPTGRIPFTTALQGCPRKGLSCVPVHFQLVPVK